MKLFTNSNDENASLGILERSSIGLCNFSNAFMYIMIASFLVYYYTNVIGLNPLTIGTIMLVSQVFDGITDLGMGYIVDHTKSKLGKARIWILRMCVPYAISGVLLFMVPANTTAFVQYIFVFVSYNVMNALLYTAITVPFNSLGALATRNSYERGLIGIFVMVFATAAGTIVNMTALRLVAFFGNDRGAWTKTTMLYAAVGLLCHLICVAGTKERVTNDEEHQKRDDAGFMESLKILIRNKYWVMFLIGLLSYWTSFSLFSASSVFYAETVFGDANVHATISGILNIANLAGMILAFIPMKKWGKGFSYKAGILIAIISYVVMIAGGKNLSVVLLATAGKGFGIGVMCSCFGGIVADSLDYGEWRTGKKTIGMGNAAVGFAQKVGTGIGGVALGWILELGGYDSTAGVAQSVSGAAAVNSAFIYIPLALSVVIFIAMFRYDLDKDYEKISRELTERNRRKGE